MSTQFFHVAWTRRFFFFLYPITSFNKNVYSYSSSSPWNRHQARKKWMLFPFLYCICCFCCWCCRFCCAKQLLSMLPSWSPWNFRNSIMQMAGEPFWFKSRNKWCAMWWFTYRSVVLVAYDGIFVGCRRAFCAAPPALMMMSTADLATIRWHNYFSYYL